MCTLFGVNPSSSTVYMDLLINELEYNFTCMKNAAPTKPLVHWNQAIGMVGGSTNPKFPVTGSLIVDKDYYKNVLLKCIQHDVKKIGMFEEWRNPNLNMIEEALVAIDILP